jgi:hypothetical protein
MIQFTSIVIMAAGLVVGGCASRRAAAPQTMSQTVTVRRTEVVIPPPAVSAEQPQQPQTLATLAHDVTAAPDRLAEAGALRRLAEYMNQNHYTYELEAWRLDSGQLVQSPSQATFPLRVNVTIFWGQQQIYSFNFLPKDNQDIALLAPSH